MAKQLDGVQIVMRPTAAQWQRAIRDLQKGLAGSVKKQANKAIGLVLVRWVGRQFDTEGQHGGDPWEPFAPVLDSYSGELVGGRRMRDGSVDESARLLQDTGALRASFIPFEDASGDMMGIGSALEYSQYHEEGGAYLPQRRMLPQHDDVALFEKITDTYIFFIKRQVDKSFRAFKKVAKSI